MVCDPAEAEMVLLLSALFSLLIWYLIFTISSRNSAAALAGFSAAGDGSRNVDQHAFPICPQAGF